MAGGFEGWGIMQFRRQSAKKVELVTAKQACKLVEEYFQGQVPPLKLKTIYNKVCSKELKRHGPRHRLLLDKDEVIQKLCRHHTK